MTSVRDGLRSERGQVLPIAALLMSGMLLIAAVAVDVTGVLASERFYITTADAAALAGAQDLQHGTTRAVSDADRSRARDHAMRVLIDELGATSSPTCAVSADISECALPGTPYLVSIVTPAPFCDRCDRERAVKVTIRNPGYPLTFARLAGQDGWNVEASAVAGLRFPGKYALIALKPQDDYDPGVVLNGENTAVRVSSGDIGTNTHLVEGSGDVIFDDSAQWIYHYNDTMKNGKLGFAPASLSKSLNGVLITDPGYVEPHWPADTYAGQTDADATMACPSEVTSLDAVTTLVDDGVITSADDVVCYKPGVYAPGKGNLKQFTVQNGDVVYLLPGAYRFEGGFDVNNGGYVYGGLVSTERGVVLSVPGDKEMDMEGATEIRLNSAVSGPAQDYLGNDIETNEPDPDERLMITFYVPRDDACFESSTSAVPIDSKSCSADTNATIKLAGTGALDINGVIYAPTERVSIRGNSASDVVNGQVVGWTLEWSGGSTLDINYPHFVQQGILRLDGACTGVVRCS